MMMSEEEIEVEVIEYDKIEDYVDLFKEIIKDLTKTNIINLLEKVPNDLIGIKNELIRLILDLPRVSNHIISRSDLKRIIKEMEIQPNGILYNPEDIVGQLIPYDDDKILIGNDNKTYLLSKGRQITICNHRINLISKVIDIRQETELFKWELDNVQYSGYTLDNIINKLGHRILRGKLGLDAIVHLIETIAKDLPLREAKYILGWDNGWYTPMDEEDKNFEIINPANIQRTVYNDCKDMYIEYTGGEKQALKKKLHEFTKLTDMPEAYKTIIIAYCMVMPFRLYFINGKFKFFPHLALYGRTTAGKTSMVQANSVDFYHNYVTQMSSDTVGSPSQIGVALTTSTFGILIDEMVKLNPNNRGKLSSTFKSTATGVPIWLKNKRDGLGNTSREQVASLLTTTQELGELFKEPALITRTIALHYDDSIKEKDEWAEMAMKLKDERPFSLLYDKTKDWLDKDLDKLVEKVKKYYDKYIPFMDNGNYIHYPRLTKTFIILLIGCYLREKIYGDKLNIDDMFKTLIESRKEIVNQFLYIFFSYMDNAVKLNYDKLILKHIHLRLYYDQEDELIVFLTDNLPDFNKHYSGFSNENIKFNITSLYERLFETLDNKILIKFNKYYRVGTRKARAILINPILMCDGDVAPTKLGQEIAHIRMMDLIRNLKAPHKLITKEEAEEADKEDKEMEDELGLSTTEEDFEIPDHNT